MYRVSLHIQRYTIHATPSTRRAQARQACRVPVQNAPRHMPTRPPASLQRPPSPTPPPHPAPEASPTPPAWPGEGPFLPEERRRPLCARMDAVLAHPRAARCTEPCRICDALPDAVAEAVLAAWDTFARAGTWPIPIARMQTALQEHGIDVEEQRLKKLFEHRRWSVVNKLVRADIAAWQRSLQADAPEG
jgi:hypothetical protein